MTVQVIAGNDLANTLTGTENRDVIYGFDPDGAQGNVSSITATRVASGLTQPVFVGAAPNDPERLFVVEKTGAIKILDLGTGTVKSKVFLDLSAYIVTTGERGLLGLAFDPDFANNGFFYVNIINTSGDSEIRRYQVSASNPNRADPQSETLILSVDQPSGRTNHKAGWLGFGKDGMLYAAFGDGGGSGDPDNNAQNINTHLGKMLRLDVRTDAFPDDPTRHYSIPGDNPFVGIAGADEIYALGLRNPWRNSFDRGTGDFYIADVGQNRWEEINLGTLGANYGWRIFEGPDEFSPDTQNGGGILTEPIHSYSNAVGNSITGGYVYRGSGEGLHGHYFFADFADNKVFSMKFDGTDWVAVDRTSQIITDIGALNSPASFGEDAEGNLYIVGLDGEVFRLTPNVTSADVADTINAGGGDDLAFGGAGDDAINGQSGDDELHGGDGDDRLVGSVGGDLLFGGRGEDLIDGGSGADKMVGQTGNDTYVVNHADDEVYETPDQGIDTVRSSVFFSLAGANLEWLVLTGTANINGTGNSLDNRITGNSGDNTLNGSNGADQMRGGLGNDIYIVDNLADQVFENPNRGVDTVRSSVFFSLDGADIERLELTGSADINGTGNPLDNTLIGNTGDNRLDGGTGADEMRGGAGNDTYIVDNAGDRVFEFVNQGVDTVRSSVFFSLANANLERLVLTGSANINGTGNSLDNALTGNSGNNTLNGLGGNDVLKGGGGSDVFRFTTTLNPSINVDVISDFQVDFDKIQLDDAIFTGLGASLTADEFVANASGAAINGSQHILYDTTDGRLFFDVDGKGGQARVHFATLTAGLALDHLDFVMI